ncbi:MAG TPA: trypsin-like peptidase domain-containing protein [Blastocatellia bacterium]|nr:trypsin-like peptidase domain-containing protein [Blastocatellia bacterium]
MIAIFTHLTGHLKGKSEKFESDRISVGRAPDNTFRFGDDARRVSAHHADIIRRGDQYVLRDLGSTNGTMINGRRVVATELRPDDMIEFGAGGPLVRFTIEQDGRLATRLVADTEELSASDQNRSGLSSGSDVKSGGARASTLTADNRRLVAALAAAMVLGAVGGLLLSSRVDVAGRGRMSFASVAERNSPAVVFIRTEFDLVDASGKVVSADARTGSGFVVSSSGLIVTNRHLVRDWEYNTPPPGITGRTTKIEVIFPGGRREEAIRGELFRIGPNPSPDVAVLKIPGSAYPPVVQRLESTVDETNQGDEVATIGYPLGLDLLRLTKDDRIETSLSVGIVSRVGQDFIQLDLRAYQGNSGGPVINRRGEVIGILTGNADRAQNIAFCTPVSAVIEMLKDETGADARYKSGSLR